jgi:outer membrane protein assembly factor BamB
VVLLAAHGLGAAEVEQANWPQFRGPNASGYSETANPPAVIGSAEGALWQVEVPWSPSSPCIWEDQIFLTAYNQGALETRAHDRKSGRLLWSRPVRVPVLEDYHSTDGSPAASTPATDGKRVVSYFGSFGLICYDFEGEEQWRYPLPLALSGGRYGSGTSPIIAGGRVVLNRDQDMDSSLLALDVRSGERLWEVPRPAFRGGFGTPVIWQNQGRNEVVLPGSMQLKGYDLADGGEIWSVGGVSAFVCTTPVVGRGRLFFGAWCPGQADSSLPMDWPTFQQQMDKNGDGRVLLSEFDKATADFLRGVDFNRDDEVSDEDLALMREAAKRAANVLLAVEPGGRGDITSSHVKWRYKRGLPYVPSPLYLDGRVYFVKDGGMVSSLDAVSGEAYYAQERIGAAGSYYASPVAADGRIYLASLPGKVTVIKAGGDHPEVLHQADFKERIFATPALVGRNLYVRTEKRLYAFGSDPGASATASVSR